MTNEELLKEAYKLAALSPDPSTQIGAFLVTRNLPGQRDKGEQLEWLTQSYNRPTANWKMQESDWARPRKYDLMCHAERGCLDRAALYGICTAGAVMVASYAACASCSRGLVACGIKKLVRHKPSSAATGWEDSISLGDEIMRQGGVELIDVVGPIPGAPAVLRSGSLFHPAESGT